MFKLSACRATAAISIDTIDGYTPHIPTVRDQLICIDIASHGRRLAFVLLARATRQPSASSVVLDWTAAPPRAARLSL